MAAQQTIASSADGRHVEFILQQLDRLPTLSGIAMRLVELTGRDDSQIDEVVQLISADPALTGHVLRMCACQDRYMLNKAPTIERAVKLLGFDAIRSSVLSLQVFELFDGVSTASGETHETEQVFDRSAFWQYSLAVALLSESLVESTPLDQKLSAGEAHIAGLLHDLGVLALHVILPQTLDRICKAAELRGISLDVAARRLLGMDTHRAGKRLAEHWQLPHALSDVMWLYSQRVDSLPDVPHRQLISVIGLASAVCRSRFVVPLGRRTTGDDVTKRCDDLGLSRDKLEQLIAALPAQVQQRGSLLGLEDAADGAQLMRTLGQSNAALGRMGARLAEGTAKARRQAQALRAITEFHETAVPGGSLVNVMGHVVKSAATCFGGRFFAVLYQSRPDESVQFVRFSNEGQPLQSRLFEPPPGSTVINDLDDDQQLSARALTILPWLADELGGADDISGLRLMPLRCGWGVHAVLVHDCDIDGRRDVEQMHALSRTWAAAIAAAAQHEGARRLGEQLAEANLQLTEAQQELSQAQAMAAIGEVAAGAAHEMNNPLTVISGRAQILAESLDDDSMRTWAKQIIEHAHHLSDMITALRTFAEPIEIEPTETDVRKMIIGVVEPIQQWTKHARRNLDIQVSVDESAAQAVLDPRHMTEALRELIRNGVESEGASQIIVSAQYESLDHQLVISVRDDGAGLSDHARTHAFDPFFSHKSAGRQAGLGLARVRRIATAHGGWVSLENGPHGGAVATIRMEQRAASGSSSLGQAA